MLVKSNFFFSHNVFKSCLLLMRQNQYLWSKGLIYFLTCNLPTTSFQNTWNWIFCFWKYESKVFFLLLNSLPNKSYENTVGNGKMLVTSILSFSHSDFYSVKERNLHFSNICHLQLLSIWSYPKFCRLVKSKQTEKYVLSILRAFADHKINALN